MSNTYTQIHIQCVFAVKYRNAVIQGLWKERLHKYIIAIVNNNGHKALAINSMPDHLHRYIANQETHHRKKTLLEEYNEI
jgi:putative transposase